ncbi:MAG: hypothetical protein PHQ40_08640 [Anaerolineaceae bacterium]|nr:hypothetical protein [Anaerolineaceae bacterium]
MRDEGEIHLSIGWLAASIFILVTGVGWFGSPRDPMGHPILLSPDVQAVEEYRRFALHTMEDLQLEDGEIAQVLANDSPDLLDRSHQAQQTVSHVLITAQELDQREVPPTLAALRDELKATSLTYLESGRLALRWLSLPEAAGHDQADQKLSEARAGLQKLEESPWLAKK